MEDRTVDYIKRKRDLAEVLREVVCEEALDGF